MTLLQLSYFVALAENLHYTKTAEQLHISQPSLSYAIGGMEKDLGVKLFVKDRQGVALSRFGKEYYPYAKKALDSLESGRRIVTSMTQYADTVVRLGYFHSISASLIPALIHSFNETPESSNIRFQLIEDSVQRLMADLYSGELDLCFSSHPGRVRAGGAAAAVSGRLHLSPPVPKDRGELCGLRRRAPDHAHPGQRPARPGGADVPRSRRGPPDRL